MLSESKKSDKFLINAVPSLHSIDSAEDFNSQFNASPEEFIQKYRLKCVIPGSSGSGLLAATSGGIGGGGSTGSVVNISSPVAPSLRSTFIAGAGDSMGSINSEKSVGVTASSIQKSPTTTTTTTNSVATLQKELKEARSEIDRLKAVKMDDEIYKLMIFFSFSSIETSFRWFSCKGMERCFDGPIRCTTSFSPFSRRLRLHGRFTLLR